jgi:hypothetical protein
MVKMTKKFDFYKVCILECELFFTQFLIFTQSHHNKLKILGGAREIRWLKKVNLKEQFELFGQHSWSIRYWYIRVLKPNQLSH